MTSHSTRNTRPRRVRRRNRRHSCAQATVEMALTFPIMVAMMMNFLGAMILIEGQNRFQAALSFAAEASITAPLATPQKSCAYAAHAFWTTVYADPAMAGSGSMPGCPGGAPGSPPPAGYGFTATDPASHTGIMHVVGNSFTCRPPAGSGSDYLDAQGYPLAAGTPASPVECTASAKFNYSGSPLAVFVFWSTTVTAHAEAAPTAVRQCDPAVAKCA